MFSFNDVAIKKNPLGGNLVQISSKSQSEGILDFFKRATVKEEAPKAEEVPIAFQNLA